MAVTATAEPLALKPGDAAKAKVTSARWTCLHRQRLRRRTPPGRRAAREERAALAPSDDNNIQLASEDQLPQDAQLVFSVRAKLPATFARNESIEVATARRVVLDDAELRESRPHARGCEGRRRDVRSREDVRLLGLRAAEVPHRREWHAGRLAGARNARAPAGAADPAMPRHARQGLQAHGLEPVPGGLGVRRSGLPAVRGRAGRIPGPRAAGASSRQDRALPEAARRSSVVNSATLTAEELPAPPTDEAASTPPSAAVANPGSLRDIPAE